MLRKQDIESLDHKYIAGATDNELETWIKKEGLSHYHGWLLPQLVAHFGTWTLQRTPEGRIDILATLKRNVGSDPQALAYWKLSRVPRALLTLKQHAHPEYATLTPLVLLGLRRSQGVPYSAWQGLANLEWVLEPKLYEALVLDSETIVACCSLGSDRLLEIRSQGLVNKAGARSGELKPASSTWALTGIRDTELGGLPKLTQTILTQIWLAHPTKRTPYMILDLQNWDAVPAPLITGEIFQKQTAVPAKAAEAKSKKDTATLPWL